MQFLTQPNQFPCKKNEKEGGQSKIEGGGKKNKLFISKSEI